MWGRAVLQGMAEFLGQGRVVGIGQSCWVGQSCGSMAELLGQDKVEAQGELWGKQSYGDREGENETADKSLPTARQEHWD